ncbi:MAG: tRNA 5-methoxyuridine(34)/uridine 5-oxyacetic acid(34) synthase CmoB [Helicobacter sp.]|nr:tRNA 5-methoxyuridine(34)/uridine 5-oxyacetic acid(34) synthase CmoB [Helicobacter sp.]
MESPLQTILRERESWLLRKDIAPLFREICALAPAQGIEILNGESVGFCGELESAPNVYALAKRLCPWRKGPFHIGTFTIDSEWVSSKKYALLEPHLNLRDKRVGDVGCNNGYYMFRMLSHAPREVVGLDPSVWAYLQFLFVNHFLRSPLRFYLLGIEHLPLLPRFDTLFCLGVLYHRTDPISALRLLKNALNAGGELFLDSLFIAGDSEFVLSPKQRYAKMKNVYFIPTQSALVGWLERVGFKDIRVVATMRTTSEEQRISEWSNDESLADFLCPSDSTRTIEGYPAPQRIYIHAKI